MGCSIKKSPKVFFTKEGKRVILESDSTFIVVNDTITGFWEFVSVKDSVIEMKQSNNSDSYYSNFYHIEKDSLIRKGMHYYQVSDRWISLHLNSMNEVDLKNYGKNSKSIFRMLILPTFSSPEVFRLELNFIDSIPVSPDNIDESNFLDVSVLTHKTTFGVGGYKAGPIRSSNSVSLIHWDSFTKLKLDTVKDLIKSIDVLNQSQINHHNYGIDGTLLMIEYYEGGKYNAIFRHGIDLELDRYYGYDRYPSDYKRIEIVKLYNIFQSLISQYSSTKYSDEVISHFIEQNGK